MLEAQWRWPATLKWTLSDPGTGLTEFVCLLFFVRVFSASHSSLELNSWRCLPWPVGFLGCSWGALQRIAAWCSVMDYSSGKHARDPHCIACIDHWDKKIYGFLKNCIWRNSDNASHTVWYIYPVWSVWQRQCVCALTVPVGKITEENGRSWPVSGQILASNLLQKLGIDWTWGNTSLNGRVDGFLSQVLRKGIDCEMLLAPHITTLPANSGTFLCITFGLRISATL
jgi:hypothetical protein